MATFNIKYVKGIAYSLVKGEAMTLRFWSGDILTENTLTITDAKTFNWESLRGFKCVNVYRHKEGVSPSLTDWVLWCMAIGPDKDEVT